MSVEIISLVNRDPIIINIYEDNKVVKEIKYNARAVSNLYYLPGRRILLELYETPIRGNVLIMNIDSEETLLLHLYSIHHIYRNVFEVNKISEGYGNKELIVININDIIYETLKIKILVPHLDFKSNLIKDFAITGSNYNEAYKNTYFITSYDNKYGKKIIRPKYAVEPILWIEDMIVYEATFGIVIELDEKTTYWSVDDLFTNITMESIDKRIRSDLTARFKVAVFYTSIPIVICTYNTNEVIHISLIKFKDYNDINIEEYIINDNEYFNPSNKYFAYPLDVDDYGILIGLESRILNEDLDEYENTNPYSYEYSWIYQSRLSAIRYYGKGISAIMDHTLYEKEIKKLSASIPELYPVLKDIVGEYII